MSGQHGDVRGENLCRRKAEFVELAGVEFTGGVDFAQSPIDELRNQNRNRGAFQSTKGSLWSCRSSNRRSIDQDSAVVGRLKAVEGWT